jgi:hypothetical protein
MTVDMNDIVGKIYPGSRLMVLERGPDYISPNPKGGRIPQYWCLCACGTSSKKLVRRDSLLRRATKSCGCLNRENIHRLGRGYRHRQPSNVG